MMVSLIIFDLDGTLMDTSEGIWKSVIQTCDEFGLPPVPSSEKDSFIGPPIFESFKRYFKLSDDAATDMMNSFRHHYMNEHLFEARPYDGIADLLRFLRSAGCKLAVATNKRDDYTHTLMDHFGMSELFDVIHGSDNYNKLTKAQIIRMCMSDLDADPIDATVVGDSSGDEIGARESGTNFIGVTYGFGFKDRWPSLHFGSVSDLGDFFRLHLQS